MVELLGGYGSTPCIYFAHDAHAGGFKVGDASCGVHKRYSGESGVTALPMVLTQTSLSAASKGGRPDTGGLRSFAREAQETLFTVAIGGGLGKASSIFGSVATLGAKPGRTSTSFKPGMVGATPAQLAAQLAAKLKPGKAGATPAQLKASFKPGLAGATTAQLKASFKPGLAGATTAQLKASFKPGLAGATTAQLAAVERRQAAAAKSQALKRARDVEAGLGESDEVRKRRALRRREQNAGANLTCTRCDITYQDLSNLRRHQRKHHPLCLPGCLCLRSDDGSKMVGCDVCDGWFHIACLARPPDDKIDEDTVFVCPPCVAAAANIG